MPKIYRKVYKGMKTELTACERCMDSSFRDHKVDWVNGREELVCPEHFTGQYEEAPFGECRYCGAVDQESRDEYEEWAADMDRMQWEEQQEAEWQRMEYM
jgi:hypothetical protein